ncbi:hypothetical protein CVT26_006536, partial [Gymnopilus dilepis]
MAISVDLLDFYDSLFEQSCDAVNAMAAALDSSYGLRGYFLVNGKVRTYHLCWADTDTSCRTKGSKNLSVKVSVTPLNGWVSCVSLASRRYPSQSPPTIDAGVQLRGLVAGMRIPSPNRGTQGITARYSSPQFIILCATSYLLLPVRIKQRLPLPVHGRNVCEGSGNFVQPVLGALNSDHLGGIFRLPPMGFTTGISSPPESIPFYETKHIIPKAFVDAVGDLIIKARKCRIKSRTPKVPDCAVDECEKSHKAADGDKKKASHERYDAMGWMSLVCRHDIPLFFANIDTPSEQQKYALASIIWFFSFVPPNATFDILPDDILPRPQLVTTAMHAYRHQWSCQLIYNPRLCEGLGLTDGEGVERIWSRLRKLIPIVRTTSTVSSLALPKNAMLKSGVEEAELRVQWGLQKAAQSSLRARRSDPLVHMSNGRLPFFPDAPVRVRKELDMVLSLQSDLDMVDKAITTMESSLRSSASAQSKAILAGLHESRRLLTNNLEALYVSLNVFNEISSIRSLWRMTSKLISEKEPLVGSFFEWDRFDQAVGGQNQTLGTKLHQQTRQAISKRAPALTTAIKKFNQYCVKLADLHDPSWNIPIPLPLPTKLADLRDDSNLTEDVWVTRSEVTAQAWLTDPDFGREIAAAELALRLPQYTSLIIQLSQRRDELIHLKSRWTSSLASSIRFETHINTAVKQAEALTGQTCATPLKWIVLTTEAGSSAERDGSESAEDDEQALAEDDEQTLADEDPSDIIVSDILRAEDDEDLINETSDIRYSEEAMVFEPGIVKRHFGAFVFDGRDLQIFDTPDAPLNDICLDGSVAVLQDLFVRDPINGNFAQGCAIFSTHDLNRVRYNLTSICGGIPTDWSFGGRMKSVSRWVLAVIYLRRREVYLFDSLAQQATWKRDMEDISVLISRLIELARRSGHIITAPSNGWVAKTATVNPVQSNNYDCGLWVLAWISVVLRETGIQQSKNKRTTSSGCARSRRSKLIHAFQATKLNFKTVQYTPSSIVPSLILDIHGQLYEASQHISQMRDRIEQQKDRFYKATKLDCIEYAAQFFPQACAEGCLPDYLAAVKKLYEDRYPSDPNVDWDTFQFSVSMVSLARGPDAKEPDVNWREGLSLKYDRSR